MEATAKILTNSANGTRSATQPRGYDILHRVGIGAAPEKVFAALTTIPGLAAWWTHTASGNASQGGKVDFKFCEMEVVVAEPGKRVVWRCTRGPSEWLGTEVTFELELKREQTFVAFSHANWKEPCEMMSHCSTKWGVFLLSLRDYVEAGRGNPAPHDVKIHVGD